MIPTAVFSIWFSGLLSLGILGGAAYLLRRWYLESWQYDALLDQRVFAPDFGANGQTALLVAGILLIVWALAGGLILRLLLPLFSRGTSDDEPNRERNGRVTRLQRPDGAELQVEQYGREDGPTVILTHGWGTDSTEWYSLTQRLSKQFRVFVWDLPGIARSTGAGNNDYSIERFAHDLDAVVDLAGGQPVVLVGHSAGGMTTLMYCKQFPEALGKKVAGIALVHTTYINPVRTTTMAGLATALERPLMVPLLYLMVWLSPLVRLMNWMSYLNGTSQMGTKLSGFAGNETQRQVEFASQFGLYLSPAVLARGMLGMLHYNATDVLPSIQIPTLIVAGDHDPVCKPDASVFMQQAIPSANLVSLAPAKHMGFMEQNERSATLIGEFAASCLRADNERSDVEVPELTRM